MASFERPVLCPDCNNPMTSGPKPSFEYELPKLTCEPCDALAQQSQTEAPQH
jgi:hypothetical protein